MYVTQTDIGQGPSTIKHRVIRVLSPVSYVVHFTAKQRRRFSNYRVPWIIRVEGP